MLSDEDQQVLDFEAGWTRDSGRKADAILQEFGWRTTRYYQNVNRIIDDPEALPYAPMTVKRLRRLRATRLRAAP